MDDIDLSDQVKKSEVIIYSLPVGSFLSQFKGGDFNGDGFMDVLIEPQVGSGTAPVPLQIFLGDGTGNFIEGSACFETGNAINTGGGGRSLEADFNNDGITDIFLINFGVDAPPFSGGKNQLFLSSPLSHKLEEISGSLKEVKAHNHGGSVGDVNGDGYLDILINTLDDKIGNVLLINDGLGQFTKQPTLIPKVKITNTFSGIFDINQDGYSDIILGSWPPVGISSKSKVLLNNGNGNFTKIPPVVLPASGVSKEIVLDVKVIDLNGDKLPDLMLNITNGGSATISYHTPYIQLLINDGKGKFHDETSIRLPQSLIPSSGYIQMLSAVDFNNDGYSDILVTSGGGEFSSKVYMNRGDGTFYKYWESAPGGNSIAEDVNNDGMTDIVTGYSDRFSINLNGLNNGHIYKGTAEIDKFINASGNDIIDGGAGVDTVIYSGASNNFSILKTSDGYTVSDNLGTEGIDVLIKIEKIQFSNETINLPYRIDGSTINDVLIGTYADDEIYGHDGNDTIQGGTGNDMIDGGVGNDIYLITAASEHTQAEFNDTGLTGIDEVRFTAVNTLGGSTLNLSATDIGIERVVIGTGKNSVAVTSGKAALNIDASATLNQLTLIGNRGANSLVANNAGDTLIGGDGNDKLSGGSGADSIDGGNGIDTMNGGNGDDTYVVNVKGDIIETDNDGTDLVKSSITYSLFTRNELENLTLTGKAAINGNGNSLDNMLIGNSSSNILRDDVGNDTLNGGSGADKLFGGSGNDTYIVDNSSDKVYETATASVLDKTDLGGIDTVESSVTYKLANNLENLILTGSASIKGTGNALNNILIGNSAANFLIGGNGSDILIGGLGKDVLTGGFDSDSFVFNSPLNPTANFDIVTDFESGVDYIQLDNSIFSAISGDNLSESFFYNVAGNHDGPTEYIGYDSTTGELFYDADGSENGSALKFAIIGISSTHPALTYNDFEIF